MKPTTPTRIDAITTLEREPIRNVITVHRGGGCVGWIGVAFASWGIVLGSMVIIGWRAGDFTLPVLLGGVSFFTIFFLCGLGVATYRKCITLDFDRRTVTQIKRVLFVPYSTHQWSVDEFEAVELYPYCRPGDHPRWFDVTRLLPVPQRNEPPEPVEICAGDTETMAKQMGDIAREIAESCNLPLIETPRNELERQNR